MKQFLNITKNPIYKTMKTILFFLPIGIITSNIYVFKYGEYVFKLNKQFISDNFDVESVVFCFVVFAVLSFFVKFCQDHIGPLIIIKFQRKNLSYEMVKKLDQYAKYLYRFNPYNRLKKILSKDEYIKYSMLQEVLDIPIMLILWLLAINTVFCYIVASLVFIFSMVLGKFLATTLNHYKIK